MYTQVSPRNALSPDVENTATPCPSRLSRLSARSLVSTLIFMAVAILTVFVTRHVMGG